MDKYFEDPEVPSGINLSDVQSVKDWLSKQPHLPHLSDRQIMTFLHSCFGSIELSKNTIDAYYTIRTHAPELFNGRTPEQVKKGLHVVYCIQLPKPICGQERGLMLGLYDTDSSKFDLVEYFRTLTCMIDILYNEYPFLDGIRLIYDMKGATVGHLTKISNVAILKKMFSFLQEGLPVRLKGIHIFNAIPLVHQFLAVMKPVMKKELYELVRVHPTSDIESFYKFVPQKLLPKNYGGDEQSIEDLIEESNKKMEKYQGWFVDDDEHGRVNESKRTGKPKNSGDVFGIEGSFKKLDID